MARTVILRFRDLVIEDGGTISEHLSLIQQYSEVWWGWWMRQYEVPPRALFQELAGMIEEKGFLEGFLFNTGATKLYATKIASIRVAPPGCRLSTPDPERSPSYYHRAECPAWFLLRSIQEVPFSDYRFVYDSFPTRPELHGTLMQMLNVPVASLEQLRHLDTTLWVVQRD